MVVPKDYRKERLIQVVLEKDLIVQLKILAAMRETTMRRIILEAITEYLDSQEEN